MFLFIYRTTGKIDIKVIQVECFYINNRSHPYDIHIEEIYWDHIAPFINDAICSLSRQDFDIIMLRFFDGYSFKSIGRQLSISEDTARVRVTIAIKKLLKYMKKSYVSLSAYSLSALLSHYLIDTAPPGLFNAVLQIVKDGPLEGSIIDEVISSLNY